jgi:hypothetical protein
MTIQRSDDISNRTIVTTTPSTSLPPEGAEVGALPLPRVGPRALAESTMQEVLVLLQQLGQEVRHAGEQRENADERREFAAEDRAVQALRDKAQASFVDGVVGGITDVLTSVIRFDAAGKGDESATAKLLVEARVGLATAFGKVAHGTFEGTKTELDAKHEELGNEAHRASTLAKRAADMVGDGRDASRAALDLMKRFIEQQHDFKMGMHFA